jgi:hypothetical protein
MSASCRDLERALETGDPKLLEAVEAHARTCAACAGELAEWRRLTQAAPALRVAWSSPELWPAIRQRLAEESTKPEGEAAAPAATASWLRLLPAGAIVALFAIATAGLWAFRNSGGRDPLASRWETTRDPILADAAADEVENAEKSYVESIEKLSRLAAPKLQAANTPLALNYREKLAVLDSAIADLKSSIEQNRYNTHLRRELLAAYREKQRTLQDLMKEVKS